MQEKSQNQQITQPVTTSSKAKRPNEQGIIQVDGFVRISDPATKQVFLETRA